FRCADSYRRRSRSLRHGRSVPSVATSFVTGIREKLLATWTEWSVTPARSFRDNPWGRSTLLRPRTTISRGALMSSLAPGLLVAAPPLADPNFDRSVVLLAAHGP